MKWFKSFMEDRTGVDHLSLALLIVSLIVSLIGNLLGWSWLAWFSLIPLVLFYFRSFSKNKLKRHQENVLFFKVLVSDSDEVDQPISNVKSQTSISLF